MPGWGWANHAKADDSDLPALPAVAAKPKPSTLDGQWRAPVGVITVAGNTLTLPTGITGNVIAHEGNRLTVLWTNGGYGHLFVNPADPDTLNVTRKDGSKVTWKRIQPS